ncbi:MAG: hypothetical protein HYV09_40120 [Deltaproteobacteria bacterium]|nr:hypothetical protein [Deltaproteobacteria bacterium]
MMRVAPLLAAVLVSAAAASAPAVSEAGQSACAGVSGSPLDGASIAGVSRLVDRVSTENKKFSFTRVVGAEVVVHADAGMTAEHLERVARCRAAAPTGAENDPIVAGSSVRVRARDGAFALQITSKDPAVARDIVARAERLR